MTNSVLIILGQLAVLSVLGLAALSIVPSRGRELLLPAAPVFGAGLLAVVMSTTSRFSSALWGLIATVLVAAAIVVLAVYKGRRPWVFSRSALVTTALVWLVCAPGLLVALIPSAIVGDNLAVMPNGNHDAYYYAAESAWLHDHSFSPGPDFSGNPGDGNATPAYGPMLKSLELSIRIGQPMVQAALDWVLGTQSVQTVTPLGALWVFLVGVATFVAVRLLRAGWWAALAGAALASSSAVLVQQAFQQNMDSLLGASLALLAIATMLAALRTAGRPKDAPPDPPADEAPGVGLWPAVLSLAALVAVYTEYSLFVAPAILGAVFLGGPWRGPWRGLGPRLRRGLTVALLAVVIAPSAWWIAARSFSQNHAGYPGTSPFYSDGFFYAVSRVLGIKTEGGELTESHRHFQVIALVATLLGLAMLIGIVASIVRNPFRGAWIALLVVTVPYLVGLSLKNLGYGQARAVSIVMPIVIVIAVLGWSELYPTLHGLAARALKRPAWVDRALVGACALAVVATAGVNLHADKAAVKPDLVRLLHYDATADTRALDWAQLYGGKDGRGISVANPDFTTQLWLAYTLRNLPLVSYPRLRFDYLMRVGYWDGEVDPYFIVGAGAFFAGGKVLDKSDKLTLVDFSDRAGVVAFPENQMEWWADAKPDGAMNGPDRGQVMVLANHLPPGQQIVMSIRTDRVNAPVSALVDGQTVARTEVTGGAAKLTIPVHADGATLIRIDLSADGTMTPGSWDFAGIDLATGDGSSG